MQHRTPGRRAPVPGLCRPVRLVSGFTLIELLVVIAVIAILAALLFPVFAQARSAARTTACLSNMRQAGIAFSLYAQDYDGFYPYAVDPADRYTPQIWNAFPAFQAQIPYLPWLHEALLPYVKSRELFHCPSDTGIVIEDFTGLELDALPTCFGKYGTSYLYRTEIAMRHVTEDSFQDATRVNVYMDGSGIWHGSGPDDLSIGLGHWYKTNPQLFARRFNTLCGDGHVKNLLFNDLQALWNLPL
jgi:general secretion pathway protein G